MGASISGNSGQNDENARYLEENSLEEDMSASVPTAEEKKAEGSIIDAIEQLVMRVKKIGLTHDDLNHESENDSPAIKQIKRRLRSRIGQLAMSWANRRSRDRKEKLSNEKTKAQKQIDELIESFMDFDHTRDRDGRKSLGETGRNMSVFEKGLLARELIKAGRKMKGKMDGFKEKIMQKVQNVRQELMQEIAQQAIGKGIHVTALQTGMPVGMIKQSIEAAGHLEKQTARTPEQQAAANEAILKYAGDVSAGNIAPPGATPGGFVNQLFGGQGQGGAAR